MVDRSLKLCLGSRRARNEVICKVVHQPSKDDEHQWHCLFDNESVTKASLEILTAPAPMAVTKHIPIRKKSK